MPKKPSALRTVTPLGNRLIVTPPPEFTETKDLQKVGAIFIPETGAAGKTGIEAYYFAKVLAAGPDCKSVKKGNTVIAPRHLVWKATIDGKVIAYYVRENECDAVMK